MKSVNSISYVSIYLPSFEKVENVAITRCHLINKILHVHSIVCWIFNEPRSEKTGLRGFRPGPTQTELYSHRRWLEA